MLLKVDGITKAFGGVKAVQGASFDVKEGSITALIGPNGAGKTTAFNLVSGFMRPDEGTIQFDGRRTERLSGHTVARHGLVRVFQTARVFTQMTVLENLLIAARHQPGEKFGAAWLMPGRTSRREREIRREAEERLALVRLTHLTHERAGALSGGQRKLLELARALMVQPKMILLDEPMAGVAPVLGEQLMEHIKELREKAGITVLIIEHDIDLVMSISDRVIVMDEGRVIADGPPDAIQANERVITAYLGRNAGAAA
ncbi:ABC transporter ATP-binding protein [Kaistia dalseonensis]|uniref:ABC-type branched-subunit amino acid transport system ATPase component n=1 Tax=Kaistia dalseonensis TaxID=410840 RepID=A0ABU0H2D2_9HYPH|nr:ABC transporter ATP-binding protein [Kaistia dalseonensis]MCX5493382.1 ABC transporter ATP-binding protein [Kaistia dalseonensis]MDQ0435940.1 ABC-type branched-subunit amino acid transport system ATPase component [Kaistia dalseonensis]